MLTVAKAIVCKRLEEFMCECICICVDERRMNSVVI